VKIIKLNAIDSTNTYLKNLSKEIELEDEVVVWAKDQQIGRGQREASWQSKPGESLTFSVFKQIDRLPAEHQFLMVMLTSLALKDALNNLSIPKIAVKWPNDILSRSKKLCGILIENTIQKNVITSCISGIGLNVNEIEFSNLPQATSMRLSSDTVFNVTEVFNEVVKVLLKRLNNHGSVNFQNIKKEYEASLFKKDVVSVFERPSGIRFNGVIKGVMDSGVLLIENEQEVIEQFQLKEIKMLY